MKLNIRRKKRLAVITVVLVLTVAAWFCTNLYILPPMVEQRLASIWQGAFTFDSAHLRWNGIAISNLRLYENADDTHTPLLEVEECVVVIPFSELFANEQKVHEVILNDAKLALYFQKNGSLATRFPMPKTDAKSASNLPPVRFNRSQVFFHRPGFPKFRAHNAKGDITINGEKEIAVVGTADHPDWQTWETNLQIPINAGDVTLELKPMQKVDVRQEMLSALPFVDPSVWKQIHLNGLATGSAHVRVDPKTEKISYRIVTNVEHGSIFLPEMDLSASDATGKALIEDGMVRITGLQASAWKGSVQGDVTLDLFPEPDQKDDTKPTLDECSGPVDWQDYVTLCLIGMQPPANVALQPPQAKQPQLELDLELKKISLSELTKQFSVESPWPVDGQASVKLKASIPINNPKNLQAYKVQGQVEIMDSRIGDLRVANAKADVNVDNGLAKVRNFEGAISSKAKATNVVKGHADLAFAPSKDFSGKLTFEGLQLEQLWQVESKDALPVSLQLTGEVAFNVPTAKIDSFADWQADGKISSGTLIAFDQSMSSLQGSVSVAKGAMKLENASGKIANGLAKGNAQLALKAPYDFDSRWTLADVEVNDLVQQATELPKWVKLSGATQSDLAITGKLSPTNVTVKGTTKSDQLVFNKANLGKAALDWEYAKDDFRISQATIDGPLGKVNGTFTLPKETKPGQVNLSIDRLDVPKVIQEVWETPIAMEGLVSGTVNGTVTSSPANKSFTTKLAVDLASKGLKVRKVAVETMQGEILIQNGPNVEYQLQGKLLGGEYKARGRYPEEPLPQQPDQESFLELKDLQLRQVGLVFAESVPNDLNGVVNAKLQVGRDSTGTYGGGGRWQIGDLRWREGNRAMSLAGSMAWNDSLLQMDIQNGDIAGGQVRGDLTYPLASGRTRFNVTLRQAELKEILPRQDQREVGLRGRVNVVCSGQQSGNWYGRLIVDTQQTQIQDIALHETYIPMRWTYSPRGQRLLIQFADSRVQLASGRATLSGEMEYLRYPSFDIKCQLDNVDLQRQFRNSSFVRQNLQGSVSGQLHMKARNLRSLRDIQGSFSANLKGVQPRSLPILGQIQQIISAQSSRSFHKGEVKGRLKNGICFLEKMTLESEQSRYVITGNTTLDGRLNLDVLANTGNIIPGPNVWGLLGLTRFLANAPLPIGVILRAQQFLSERLIALHITGTIRSPHVRVDAARLIAEETIRFFLAPIPISR